MLATSSTKPKHIDRDIIRLEVMPAVDWLTMYDVTGDDVTCWSLH